jgi:hypothetical protein
VSPYLDLNNTNPNAKHYTQDQLNMRRKAEILKYNNPSQSNRFTKKQLFAQLVNGNSPIKNPQANTCNTDMIPTPSYACGVPGPVTYFIRDTTIPLYNYKTNTASYAVSNIQNDKLWTILTENNVFFSSQVNTKLFTLIINEQIDSRAYHFTFQTPIGLYLTGSTTTTIPSIDISNISYGITAVYANVLYNEDKVDYITSPTVPPMSTIPVALFDISFIPQPLLREFNMIYYAGMLTVSNIGLYTSPGYVYDFYLTINTNDIAKDSDFYSGNFSTNYAGVYCNLSASNIDVSLNTFIRNPTGLPYNNFLLTGTSIL